MKTKRALLPVLTGALLLTLGLAGCGAKPADGSKEGGQSNIPDTSAVEEEVKINVTAEGDKKELQVGETVQLHADQEGVEWGTRSPEIVSVSATGLVTAVAPGSARVTARKDGFAAGSITITVAKAPERAAKYSLPMEDADHYSPTDTWGGSYRTDDSSTPVHSSSGHTEDGTCLGYFANGCKETLTFTSNKAFKAEIGVTMAYNSPMAVDSSFSVTFNGAAVDLTGKTTEAPEDGDTNNYYDFHTVSFGEKDILNGTNVLVLEVIGSQAPNLDEFKIFTEEEATITVVKPVVLERIQVTPASVSLKAGETQQLTTITEGVSYESSDVNVASVSTTGLVTGVAKGNATITVSKEGMKSATVSVRVTEPREIVTYDLVAGTTVRMEAEAGEFYCDAGQWGQDMSGNWSGPNHDQGETPIEDQESASGGMSLGYFNQTSKVTIKFNSPKAGTVAVKLCGANAAEFDLAAGATIKVNDTALDLTGKVIEAGGENNYYDWKVVELGNAAVVNGANTISIEILSSQGFNIDYVELTLA